MLEVKRDASGRRRRDPVLGHQSLCLTSVPKADERDTNGVGACSVVVWLGGFRTSGTWSIPPFDAEEGREPQLMGGIDEVHVSSHTTSQSEGTFLFLAGVSCTESAKTPPVDDLAQGGGESMVSSNVMDNFEFQNKHHVSLLF